MPLKVFRFEASVFGNARQHFRTDFFPLMEGEHHIRPAVARKNPVRSATLPFDGPTNAKRGGEDAPCLA